MPQGTPGCPTTTVDQNLDHVGGFAKVFRKVWDHPYWQDAERFRAWIDCILLARWRDGFVMWRGRRVFVPRGSFLTSERILAERWGRSRQWVKDFITEGEKYGELAAEKDQSGCQLTLLNYAKYHGADARVDATDMPRICHGNATPLYEEVQEAQEETPDAPVDNSVDNPPMPRMVAEVVEAFQQASGVVRAPSVREKVRVEKAIVQAGGVHVPIREFVRACITKAKASGSAPTSVCYAIAAWENEQLERESASRRPASRREPQDRPLRPGYHATAAPLPRRELSDEQSKGALGSIGGILKKLGLPSTGGKK